MADKTIGQLTAATQLNDQDLMVLEQGGTAKKMAGSVLKQYVVGQGGIDHITLNADYTLTVTYTSGQSWTTPQSIRGAQGAQGNPGTDGEDGNGIVSVTKTGTSGLIDTYTITFTDGTTSTFQITNGEDGNTPVITATKSGKVTTIYSDGVAIATINDGEDGQGAVDSVNGQTGTVVLNADDVNAAPAWQSSATYAAGAYCIHNGYLWHNTSGASSTNVEPGTNYNVWNVTYSNENLLDNPWFTKGNVVNQRGVSAFTTNAYGIDRWAAYPISDGSITLIDDGIKFKSNTQQSTGNIVQFIEMSRFNPSDKMTLSILYSDGFIEHASGDFGQRITIPTTRLHDAYVDYIQSSLGYIRIVISNDYNVGEEIVRAIKLEKGSISTLANDTAPNYAEELAKCQRYFQIFKTQSLRHTDKDDFRPTMRVNPSNSTITIGGTTYYTSSAEI